MKETPILFSTPMVQAILNGTKTQTRRVINPKLLVKGKPPYSVKAAHITGRCKYGIVGELMYVKETFYALGRWKKNGLTKTGKQKWVFIDSDKLWFYENHKPTTIRKNSYRKVGWYKRPSLFMPKAAARLWLQITGIRVERLQTITEADAKAEGAQMGTAYYKDNPRQGYSSHQVGFIDLWCKINGVESWVANPYVWVIEFKVISKTGKP